MIQFKNPNLEIRTLGSVAFIVVADKKAISSMQIVSIMLDDVRIILEYRVEDYNEVVQLDYDNELSAKTQYHKLFGVHYIEG